MAALSIDEFTLTSIQNSEFQFLPQEEQLQLAKDEQYSRRSSTDKEPRTMVQNHRHKKTHCKFDSNNANKINTTQESKTNTLAITHPSNNITTKKNSKLKSNTSIIPKPPNRQHLPAEKTTEIRSAQNRERITDSGSLITRQPQTSLNASNNPFTTTIPPAIGPQSKPERLNSCSSETMFDKKIPDHTQELSHTRYHLHEPRQHSNMLMRLYQVSSLTLSQPRVHWQSVPSPTNQGYHAARQQSLTPSDQLCFFQRPPPTDPPLPSAKPIPPKPLSLQCTGLYPSRPALLEVPSP